MRIRTIFLGLLLLIILIPAIGLGYLMILGPEDLKRIVVDRVEAETGRRLTIDGPFDLALSLTPSLSAEDISFQNAPWGSQPELARIGRLEVQIDLVPLVSGTLDVLRVRLTDADILIETSPAGVSNLDFGAARAAAAPETAPRREAAPPRPAPPAPPARATIPVIRDVEVDNVTVALKDQRTGGVRTLHVREFDISGTGAQTPLDASVVGDFDSVEFEIAGALGAPARMASPTEPWPLTLTGTAGDISLDLAGTIEQPTLGRGLAIDVQARGPEVAAIGFLLGRRIPQAGAFRVVTTVVGDLDGRLSLVDVDAKLGETEAMSLTAKGQVGSAFEAAGLDLSLSARGSGLHELAAIVGRAVPDIGPYAATAELTGDAFGTLAIRDLDADIGSDDTVRIKARGNVASVVDGGGVDLELSATGAQWGDLPKYAPVDLDPQAFPPIGPFDIGATLSGDMAGTLAVDGLRADIGGEDTLSVVATGAVASAMEGGGIDLALQVAGAEFSDLIARFAPQFTADGRTLPSTGAFRVALAATGDMLGTLALSDIDAEIGDLSDFGLSVKGGIGSMMDAGGLDLRLHIAGPETAVLNDLLPHGLAGGITIPALGPYDVVAHVSGDVRGVLSLSDLDAQVGAGRTAQITLRGDVADVTGQRGLALDARIQGWELGRLGDLLPPELLGDLSVPRLGPYDVAGRLTGDVAGVLAVSALKAAVGTADSTLIEADGSIDNVRALTGVALRLRAEGQTLADLAPALGAELPPVGPFEVKGDLAGGMDGTLALTNLTAGAGESDLAGDVTMAFSDPRPALTASLESRRLNLDSFRGFAPTDPTLAPQGRSAGASPATAQAAAPAVAAQRAQPAPPGDETRVFSADPLPLDRLVLLDMALDLQAAELIAEGQRIDSARAGIDLKDGRLSLSSLEGNLGGGAVSGTLTFDSSQPVPSLTGNIAIDRFDLGSLLAAREIMQGFRGRPDIRLAGLSSTGRSVRELMANLDAELSLTMGAGRMDAREVDRLSGGFADLTRVLLGGSGRAREMPVNCMVLDYSVKGGVGDIRKALFDTDIVTVVGEGGANLATERINMFVGGRPKVSGFAPTVGARISGTFAEPETKIDRSAAATAAGSLILGEILGAATPGSGTVGALIGALTGNESFPCEGVPGATNLVASDGDAQAETEAPADRDGGNDIEQFEQKLDSFLKGLLDQ